MESEGLLRLGLALIGLIAFSGCGGPEDEDEVVSTEATAGSGPTCRSFSLAASKRYNPTRFTDGSLSFAPAFNLAIPSRIPVKAGKAGNSDHRLTLKITSGSRTETCTYRGAGSGPLWVLVVHGGPERRSGDPR